MNPVQIAGSIVESMKSHPFLLAFVLTNGGLLLLLWFELQHMFLLQKEVAALLSKCVDPEVLRSLGLIK